MPIHDWTRVEAGIFHHFHHSWIEGIKRTLNAGLLPESYYALAERHAERVVPEAYRLGGPASDMTPSATDPAVQATGTGLLAAPPRVRITAETDLDFYRRKQSTVTVRHVSDDSVVALVEVVSPGNKSGRRALQAFLDKAGEVLEGRIHLLVLDLHPPGSLDPRGIHGALWEHLTGEGFEAPRDTRLTLASYQSAESLRAYVEPVAVGDTLPAMPLYLEPRAYVEVPLEPTYQAAFLGVPRRWRRVLEGDTA
jgi:hypothetical protein